MGTDLRGHIEVKVYGKWHHYCIVNAKYYPAFAKMVGVRNSFGYTPIVDERGLPDDASDVTKIHWQNESGYYPTSWMSSSELIVLDKFLKNNNDESIVDYYWKHYHGIFGVYLFGNTFIGLFDDSDDDGAERYPQGLEDFRLVFWFD